MAHTTRSAALRIEGDNQRIMELSEASAGHRLGLRPAAPGHSCSVPLYIGVFFDGTNNNRERDEPLRCHSNVARLYNAHRAVDADLGMDDQGHYRIYVPGIGTRFEPNEEWRESMEGKAMGKGGQARILYAVLETVNAVHRAFSSNLRLLDGQAITAKLKDYVLRVEQGVQTNSEKSAQKESRAEWLKHLNAELRAGLNRARKERSLPEIPLIRVNVFGFSRGAATARAFCFWLKDLLDHGRLAGAPLEIGFLGLFDCVAGVGLSHAMERSIGTMGLADGHFDWAREILGELPSLALHGVHMVAAHEQRLAFPLTRLRGADVTEIVYPGVHCDVGGAYAPGSQGRACQENELLSQIPLADMHREARRWDVPLVDWLHMDERLRRDYAISPRLIDHWNSYMAVAAADWQAQAGQDAPSMGQSADFGDLVRQHWRLYLHFRRRYEHPDSMHMLLNDLGVQGQDREDIVTYNRLLRGDVELLALRREAIALGQVVKPDVIRARAASSNLRPQELAARLTSPEDASIAWALQQYERNDVASKGHHPLLIHQVHDSLAGFYLAGYITDEDKAEKLLAIVRQTRSGGAGKLEPYQQQVFENYEARIRQDPVLREMIDGRLRQENAAGAGAATQQDGDALKDKHRRDSVFTAEEGKRAAALFPVQTDAHADTIPDGMENVVRVTSRTRREGGGYLLGRAILDGGKP